jgi:hypothetical protein
MIVCIIEVDARYAPRRTKRSNPPQLVGKVQATRKNLLVIDVDLDQDIQLSCWSTMWMVT